MSSTNNKINDSDNNIIYFKFNDTMDKMDKINDFINNDKK